jgi:hypothetical protein
LTRCGPGIMAWLNLRLTVRSWLGVLAVSYMLESTYRTSVTSDRMMFFLRKKTIISMSMSVDPYFVIGGKRENRNVERTIDLYRLIHRSQFFHHLMYISTRFEFWVDF